MMTVIRVILLLLFGLLSLGSGLCTLGMLPQTAHVPGLLVFLVPSGLFAVGCFFIARLCYRGLTRTKEDDPES